MDLSFFAPGVSFRPTHDSKVTFCDLAQSTQYSSSMSMAQEYIAINDLNYSPINHGDEMSNISHDSGVVSLDGLIGDTNDLQEFLGKSKAMRSHTPYPSTNPQLDVANLASWTSGDIFRPKNTKMIALGNSRQTSGVEYRAVSRSQVPLYCPKPMSSMMMTSSILRNNGDDFEMMAETGKTNYGLYERYPRFVPYKSDKRPTLAESIDFASLSLDDSTSLFSSPSTAILLPSDNYRTNIKSVAEGTNCKIHTASIMPFNLLTQSMPSDFGMTAVARLAGLVNKGPGPADIAHKIPHQADDAVTLGTFPNSGRILSHASTAFTKTSDLPGVYMPGLRPHKHAIDLMTLCQPDHGAMSRIDAFLCNMFPEISLAEAHKMEALPTPARMKTRRRTAGSKTLLSKVLGLLKGK